MRFENNLSELEVGSGPGCGEDLDPVVEGVFAQDVEDKPFAIARVGPELLGAGFDQNRPRSAVVVPVAEMQEELPFDPTWCVQGHAKGCAEPGGSVGVVPRAAFQDFDAITVFLSKDTVLFCVPGRGLILDGEVGSGLDVDRLSRNGAGGSPSEKRVFSSLGSSVVSGAKAGERRSAGLRRRSGEQAGIGQDIQPADQKASLSDACFEEKAQFVVEMEIGDSLNDGAVIGWGRIEQEGF